MTEQGQRAAAIWRERDFASDWASADVLRGMLDFPRHIAATITGMNGGSPQQIVDIASGPGDFLAVFLEQFPAATGIWTDASEAMLDLARARLAPFDGRVEFRLADMTDLAAAHIPAGTDVITTSRAAHHLDPAGLHAFYRQAAGYLSPGGWLINLDHVLGEGPWNERLRSARSVLVPRPAGEQRSHSHDHPAPAISDHLAAYAAAGISDVDIPWRAFVTCLFMGRRAS